MWIFRRFRAVFAFTALVAVSACTSWQPYEMHPIPSNLPSSVRVTLRVGEPAPLRVGEQVTLVQPRILGDTLLVGRRTRHGPESLAFPVSRIQWVESRQLDAGKTALVVLLTTVVAGAGGFLLYAYGTAH